MNPQDEDLSAERPYQPPEGEEFAAEASDVSEVSEVSEVFEAPEPQDAAAPDALTESYYGGDAPALAAGQTPAVLPHTSPSADAVPAPETLSTPAEAAPTGGALRGLAASLGEKVTKVKGTQGWKELRERVGAAAARATTEGGVGEKLWKTVKKRRTPIFGAILGGILLFSIVSFFWSRSSSEVDDSMLIPNVHVIRSKKETLEFEVRAPGTITFLEKAGVASKVLGRVEKLFVDQGALVRKDQPLAQMETFELELQLKQAQSSLNSAVAQFALSKARYATSRREMDRQIKDLERIQSDIIDAKANYINARRNLQHKQEIYEMGGISREELKSVYAEYISTMSRYYQTRKNYQIRIVGFRDSDLKKANFDIPKDPRSKRETYIDFNTQVERGDVTVAEAALKNAQLQVESVQLLLRESSIKSPLAGVVASRDIEVGEAVKEGEPLFTVIRMDQLLISTTIPEEEIQNVRIGQEARFTIDAFDGLSMTGSVHQISPVIDVNTRTAEVRILAQNTENRLSPGMFVRCAIATRKKENAIAIPETSILDRREENGQTVGDLFVIQDGLAFRRKVLLGERYSDRIEILEGLESGEEVAADNVQTLKDGAKVNVIGEAAPADGAAEKPTVPGEITPPGGAPGDVIQPDLVPDAGSPAEEAPANPQAGRQAPPARLTPVATPARLTPTRVKKTTQIRSSVKKSKKPVRNKKKARRAAR